MTQEVALRRLVEFNPAVPTSLRMRSHEPARILPMDDIQHFDRPTIGEKRSVGDLLQGYSYVEPTDVAYAKVTPCFENGKGIIGSDLQEPTFASSEVTVLRPGTMLDQRYLSYVLRSESFRGPAIASMTGAGGLKRVDEQEMRAFKVRTPPMSEQKAIADYLDHETAEIDAFIADQETLSGLLQERSGSLRTAAWGTYVDGAYNMAPLDPLPAIPSHWRWVRAKNLMQERDGKSTTGSEELLSVSHLTGVTPRAEKTVHMFEAESTVGYKTVEPGNVIINTMWAWMGALGVSADFGIVSPAYGVYEFHEREIEPRFYDHLVRSAEYVQLMTNHSRGLYSSRLRLYPENFLRLPIPLPPLSEQRQISAWIDDQFHSAEKTSTLLAHSVDLARERRAALISAAVTGQIDVTTRHKPVAEVLEDEVRERV